MSAAVHTAQEASLVTAQIGRVAREPWRVAAACRWGHPTVIVSPSTLGDGTPFPTYAWLTCPWLAQRVSAVESAGGVADWDARLAADQALAGALCEADSALRAARAAESGGRDECATVGIAGQREPRTVKCLHAHVALALVGIDDPVGMGVLAVMEDTCPDERCSSLSYDADEASAR